MPKKMGMKKAVIMPRNWPWIWPVRMGDSPISTPAMKAPSTVRTPSNWVIPAKQAMITRMVVTTGKSLRKLSLTQRMAEKTSQRPTVKQKIRNSATPPTVLATFSRSKPCCPPAPTMPKVMAMITQPTVSSMMAVATMIWPRSRRMKCISRTTIATILMEEIDSAVPRNNDVARPLPPSKDFGPNWPSAKPQAKGKAIPHSAMANTAHPDLRTSLRSVSIPVSSSSIRMPTCDRPSIMPFCASFLGKMKCCAWGQTQPNREGPRTIPASKVPISAG